METKTCIKCTDVKPVNEFAWKNQDKGKRHANCKSCMSARSRSWYLSNASTHKANVLRIRTGIREHLRKKKAEYLSEHPCVDCGESDPIVLDFDHRDASTKSDDISAMTHDCVRWSTILIEIGKCDIRCANCHRRRTVKQFGRGGGARTHIIPV